MEVSDSERPVVTGVGTVWSQGYEQLSPGGTQDSWFWTPLRPALPSRAASSPFPGWTQAPPSLPCTQLPGLHLAQLPGKVGGHGRPVWGLAVCYVGRASGDLPTRSLSCVHSPSGCTLQAHGKQAGHLGSRPVGGGIGCVLGTRGQGTPAFEEGRRPRVGGRAGERPLGRQARSPGRWGAQCVTLHPGGSPSLQIQRSHRRVAGR